MDLVIHSLATSEVNLNGWGREGVGAGFAYSFRVQHRVVFLDL